MEKPEPAAGVPSEYQAVTLIVSYRSRCEKIAQHMITEPYRAWSYNSAWISWREATVRLTTTDCARGRGGGGGGAADSIVTRAAL
jgi:hypothetical protein